MDIATQLTEIVFKLYPLNRFGISMVLMAMSAFGFHGIKGKPIPGNNEDQAFSN